MPAPDNQALAPGPAPGRLPAADPVRRRPPRQAYAEPSELPGWTRAHVLAHVALNARRPDRRPHRRRRGQAVPMYPSQDARDGDIAELADRGCLVDPATVSSAPRPSSQQAVAAVPDDGWATVIERTPGSGRTFLAVRRSRACGSSSWRSTMPTWPWATGRPNGRPTSPPSCSTRCRAATTGPSTPGRPTSVAPGRSAPAARPCPARGADLGWWLTGRGAGAGLTSDSGSPAADQDVVT